MPQHYIHDLAVSAYYFQSNSIKFYHHYAFNHETNLPRPSPITRKCQSQERAFSGNFHASRNVT